VDFLPGVNLIMGLDTMTGRSNGSGKSGFVESIDLALFGRTNKGVKKSQIINWKNKRNCEDELRFRKGGNSYKIIRNLAPDLLEIYENDSLITPPADVRSYQRMLENEILGFDFQTFSNLVHTNLNYLTPILQMNATDKRHFLERIFGLEIFSMLNIKSNEKIKAIGDGIYKITVGKDFTNKAIRDLEDQIKSLQERLSNILSSHNALENQKIIYEKLRIERDDAAEERKEIDRDLGEWEIKLEEIAGEIKIQENAEFSLFKEIEFLQKQLEQADAVQDSLKKRDEYIIRQKAIETTYGNIDTKLADEQIEIETFSKQLANLETLYDKANKTVIDNKAKREIHQGIINSLKNRKICPTCGTEITESGVLDRLEREIVGYDKTITENKKQRDHAKRDRDNLSKELEKKKSQRILLEGIKSESTHIANFIQGVNANTVDTEGVKNDIEKRNMERAKYSEELHNLREGHKTISEKIQDLKKNLLSIDIIYQNFEKAELTVHALEEKVEHEETMRDEIRRMITENEKKIENIKAEAANQQIKITKLNEMTDYLEYIKYSCRDENAKQYAISAIMPLLNRLANKYLSDGGVNFYLKLDNWLEEEIAGPGITNASYSSLSGGEQKSVNVALQLAFLDIAQLQSGIECDILVLDEIIDSSVDSVGIANVLKIIRKKQAETGKKVFIITHRNEIEDFDVDHVYTVRKEKGFSHVSVV
jgi:DNA repair exonuclease SbcCD ATPase subunit